MRYSDSTEGGSAMTLPLIIVALIAVGFGVARFRVPLRGLDFRDTFKDLAHLFVGGVFGAAFAFWSAWEWWAIAVGLTLVEVVAAVVRRPTITRWK